ncbi:MAG TPA: sterol desaturase family protein, partial [Burkholderiaceae bacterium]|nr:sterol desaturase family protein [Burkholderiaceae bacterium]
MQGAQIIVLATPVFLLLIAIEFVVGWARGRNTYRLNDALNSIGLGVMSQIAGVFTKAMTVGIYAIVYEHFAWLSLSEKSIAVWLGALLLYDLCYYWHHRLGHTCALFWAAHVVHHQSEDYNLSTALRQTSSGWLAGWIFYLPMAVLGVPTLVFAVVALIDLLYQYWVHTQQIGKLGWFDRWFCSPSNHRVHHAVNEKYLDKNYGGILIIWDKLFGTFEPEVRRIKYGLTKNISTYNPFRIAYHEYASIVGDVRSTKGLRHKLGHVFGRPGWTPPHPSPGHLTQADVDRGPGPT